MVSVLFFSVTRVSCPQFMDITQKKLSLVHLICNKLFSFIWFHKDDIEI